MKDQGRTNEVEALVSQRLQPALAAYSGAAQAALQHQASAARHLQAQTTAQFANSRRLVLGAGVAAPSIGALLAWLLTGSIATPVRRAVAQTGQVAQGRLSAPTAHGRTDEIGACWTPRGR